MSDAYKIFRQIQERDKKAKQYTNYEKEDLIDEILELQEREEELQNNWNELKKFVEERLKDATWSASGLHEVQIKMQKLENRKV